MSTLPDQVINETLGRLAASGAERSRMALSRLLGEGIRVREARAEFVEGETGVMQIHDSIEPGAVARLMVSGPVSGTAFVVFPQATIDNMGVNFGFEAGDTDSITSMTAEVANITTAAYLNELGDLWAVELDPSTVDLDVTIADIDGKLREAEVDGMQVILLGCGFEGVNDGRFDIAVIMILERAAVLRLSRMTQQH